jgi:hypothetical protein
MFIVHISVGLFISFNNTNTDKYNFAFLCTIYTDYPTEYTKHPYYTKL